MLDEAITNLDSSSEEKVQKAFKNLSIDRMTLVVAHRLSTISEADSIIFIENGTVTGQGTHSELFSSYSLYKEYVYNQFMNLK